MRTQYPFVAAVCIAIAFLVVSMSGVGAVFGTAGQPSISSAETLEENVQGESVSAEGGVSGSSDGELTEFIVNGLSFLGDMITFALFLPLQLQQLGLPYFWAYPLGIGAQLLTLLGFTMLAMNRRYQ